eukprot:115539_1
MLPQQSLSHQTPFRVSPAKARKLENVMRGGSNIVGSHTQIGFGNDAVDVNDLFPMEISKTIPEYTTVNKMTMRNRRRSSSSQFVQDTSSNDSLSGRKRRQNEVPLISYINHPNKRHCNHNDENSRMMLIDENSQYMTDIHLKNELQLTHKENNKLNSENICLRNKLQEIEIRLNKQIEIISSYEIKRNLNAERNERACNKLKLLLNEIAHSERQERETKLIEDNKMLGRVIQCRGSFGPGVSDIWEDGQLFEDLKRRKKIFEKEKEEIENKKKEFRKLKSKKKKKKKNENLWTKKKKKKK